MMRRVALEALSLAVLAFVSSAMLTKALRAFSRKHGLLDVPNERSSHSAVTPRGGGLAIVVTATVALLALRWFGAIRSDLLLALIGGGIAVAVVGFLDDRHRLPAGIRLAVHVAAALWALACLGGLPPLAIGDRLMNLSWVGHALALLGIVWALNLFNFMDGIDGIAASEAVFVAGGGALLSLVGGWSDLSAGGLVVGAACLGFLRWNWPPATIFMGDVGSGYLGFVIAVMAVAAARDNPVAIWVWLILGGVFFVDATVTLVRRALRGERLHEAHRSHAYQYLVRRWGSHRRVTLMALLLNIGWLLPCATAATLWPGYALWFAAGALTPLFFAALIAGAGRREQRAP
jgi:Fuc2NAc and GlcNAc transferase